MRLFLHEVWYTKRLTKLCVAESREERCDSSDEEGEEDGGAGRVLGHLASQHVDAHPEGGAHTQGRQVEAGEAAGERLVWPSLVNKYFLPT